MPKVIILTYVHTRSGKAATRSGSWHVAEFRRPIDPIKRNVFNSRLYMKEGRRGRATVTGQMGQILCRGKYGTNNDVLRGSGECKSGPDIMIVPGDHLAFD